MMDQPEILILLRLLTAHLFADFILQPFNWIMKRQTDSVRAPQLYYHVGVVGVLTYLLLGDWTEFLLPLFIMVTHFLIDWWKSTRPATTRSFVIDQLAHLSMILIGWIVYSNTGPEMHVFLLTVASSPTVWILFVSYLLVTWPSGYFITEITRNWRSELSGDYDGLENAGMWIGITERFLILTFILLNQYGAIGFLIAAKSVFRFSGRMENSRDRKETEYILIGTLLSFALSIVIGIATSWLLEFYG